MRRFAALRVFLMSSMVLIALTVGGSVVGAQGAENLNSHLRGDYAFTWTRVCVQVNLNQMFGSMASPFAVPSGGATTRTSTIKGVFTYNGNGTGSVTGTELQIFHNMTLAGQTPVAQGSFTADLLYTVNPDRSFTQELINLNGTVLTGGIVPIGTMVSTEGIHIEGQIAPNRQVLLLGDVSPNTEVFRVPAFNAARERICGRSGSAIRTRSSDD